MNILDDIQGKIKVQGIVTMRDGKLVIDKDGEYIGINFDQEPACYLRYQDETSMSPTKNGGGKLYDAIDKYALVAFQLSDKYTEASVLACMANQINSIRGVITRISTNQEIIKTEEKLDKTFYKGIKILFNYERLYAPTNCPELVCVC